MQEHNFYNELLQLQIMNNNKTKQETNKTMFYYKGE